MTQKVAARIAELLETARLASEEAMSLGKQHNVPVNLGSIGITEDMWYVDPAEYRQQYIEENILELDDNFNPIERELTTEETQQVNDYMVEVENSGGYDDYGNKILGWMSSSTNC